MAKAYPMLSSDGHLEVLPERWTGRMPAQYRELAPRTTTLPDGSDAIVMEGAGPFKVNYIDLRGGRKAEEWQPVGVKVQDTPGIGPPEQRVAGTILIRGEPVELDDTLIYLVKEVAVDSSRSRSSYRREQRKEET